MASNSRAAAPSRRRLVGGLLSLGLATAAGATLGVPAAEAASAKIEFRVKRAGFVVGVAGGRGTLIVDGKRHRLRIGGVSLGATIGLASVEFVGRVRNLRNVRDIEGNYTAIGAGVAAAGGAGVARLRNSRGVELEVSGRQIGIMASVDLSGMRVTLA